MSRPWLGRRWFVDVEGNGARVSEIVELGAVETIDLEPTGRTLRWMVKPREPIDPYATKVHGIRNSDVRGLPGIETCIPGILDALHGVAIGGHAVHGDMDIITRDVPGWRPSSAIDSLIMSRNLVEKEGGHRLSAVVEHLGLGDAVKDSVGGRSHTAVYDAMASAMVLRHLRDIVDPAVFDRSWVQAESLASWDGMVRRRIAKAEKAIRDAASHEERRRRRQENGR